MSDALEINDRLYQRGQTWRECLGSWEHEREILLRHFKDSDANPLRFPKSLRFLIWYQRDRVDTMPQLAFLLRQSASDDRTRFFDADVFFSRLYEVFGRSGPAILAVDSNGQTVGPVFLLKAGSAEDMNHSLENYLSSLPG